MIYSSYLCQHVSWGVELWWAHRFYKNGVQTKLSLSLSAGPRAISLFYFFPLSRWCLDLMIISATCCLLPAMILPPVWPEATALSLPWSLLPLCSTPPLAAAATRAPGTAPELLLFHCSDPRSSQCCCCCCFLTPVTWPLLLALAPACTWTCHEYYHGSALLPDLPAMCCHHLELPGRFSFLPFLFP